MMTGELGYLTTLHTEMQDLYKQQEEILRCIMLLGEYVLSVDQRIDVISSKMANRGLYGGSSTKQARAIQGKKRREHY